MSKPRGKNADDYTLHPSRRFSLEWTPDPGKCDIFFLTERQTAVLRNMVQVFPKYYWVWGIKGPQRNWTPAQWGEWETISAFIAELEAALVSGCDANAMLAEMQRLRAAIAGEVVTVDVDGEPTEIDYTDTGLIPTLREIGIAPVSWQNDLGSVLEGELSLADIVKTGLIGNRLDLTPLPFEGDGLADITDDRLDQLQDRFVMTDSSIFNPLTAQKNITEALETLLRRDKATDLEFLTPNVATILETTFQVGDGLPAATIKTIGRAIAKAIGLPQSTIDNLIPADKEYFTTAEILLLMLQAMQKLSAMDIDASTVVNLNNTTNCGAKNGNAPTDEQPTTLQITDEGVVITGPDDPPLLTD